MSVLSDFRRGVKRSSSVEPIENEENNGHGNAKWRKNFKHEKAHRSVFQVRGNQWRIVNGHHPGEVFEVDDRGTLLNQGYALLDTKLGAGRYCKVRLAEDLLGRFHRNPKRLVAVKIVDTETVRKEFKLKFLPREVSIWPLMRHPNLVRMYQHIEWNSKHFMILEYVAEGDLLAFVRTNGAPSMEVSRRWMEQLISAVAYMHAGNIAHRDLKLINCDDGDCLSETFCGSKAYSAPEILDGSAYDPFKADVWSLGVIAFILVTGFMPYNENVSHQAVIVKAQKDRAYHYPSKLNIPSLVSQSIDKMMTFHWETRPNIQEVKELQWFQTETLCQNLQYLSFPEN